MKLNINANMVTAMRELGLQTDYIGSCLLVLECMMNGNFDVLDAFDDHNKNKHSLTIYKELEKVGFVKRTPQGKNNFALTDEGILVLNRLNEGYRVEVKEEVPVVDDWIEQFRLLWVDPETNRFYMTPDRRSLGASVKDLSNRMKKFLSEYREIFTSLPNDLTPEKVILKATESYIDEFKKVKFAYAKDAFNFIMKQEGKTKDTIKSLLATNCENYIMSYNKPQKSFKRDKSVN